MSLAISSLPHTHTDTICIYIFLIYKYKYKYTPYNYTTILEGRIMIHI